MKLKSSMCKGYRIFKSTHPKRPLFIEPIGSGWWFNIDENQWVNQYPEGKHCISSYYSMKQFGLKNVWSLKAAKRRIAKWDVPKGTWFIVSLPWVGHTFKIRK